MRNRARLSLVASALIAAVTASPGAQAPAQGRGQPGNIGPRPGVGPADRPPVDAAAATRGRSVWAAECITCHGSQARGTEQGPSVIRSQVFLTDRFGNQLGPFLKKGHPMQSGRPATALTDAEVTDLSHFLRERMHDTLRGSPVFKEGDILTGDPKAGAAYFNGDGKCSTCHSATSNNLAGIGGRYDAVDLQQRMLFPGGGRGGRGRGASSASAVTVTVTPATGEPISGVLVQMDDLHVTLRDASGVQRIIRRSPGVKVVKNVPLKAHHELLDVITDKNIHDLVAYLWSLK
jgi:mono/diheme cytochrome c family protein